MKTLVATVESGMCDRICLLLGAYNLASWLGRHYEYVWEKNENCPCGVDALFEPSSFTVLHVKPSDTHSEVPLTDLASMEWNNDPKSVKDFLLTKDDEPVLKIRGFPLPNPWGMWGNNQFLRYNSSIVGLAEEFLKKHRPAIGVHIRGTDYMNKMPPSENFFQAIDRTLGTDEKFFLASDEQVVRSLFYAKYGDRCVLYLVPQLRRDSFAACFAGAVEHCILRMCPTLILSGYSKFSRLACNHWQPNWDWHGINIVKDNL